MVSPMTTTPEVELQAVLSPAVMAMCATKRVVVVLPLVPVIETTGTRGAMTVEPGPGSTDRTRSAAAAMVPSTCSAPAVSRSFSTGPTCSPVAWPQPRWRHGSATTMSSTVLPVRVRTPSRLTPTPLATRRTTWAARRRTNRWR